MLLLRFVWSVLLSSVISVAAQNLYPVRVTGVCTTIDASGRAIDQPLNNRTLLREWAARAGVAGVTNLRLAFRQNGDIGGGHSIDLIRSGDPTPIISIFPLAFPESAATPSGRSAKRFAYVYDINHSEFSRGTAVMKEQIFVSQTGRTNRLLLDGTMQWYWLPALTNGFRICRATIHVDSKPLVFH